ncbi:nucleotidyltransferase family protein [Baekduia soli]|uniref:Nucleotidyltransferase family protein n=1 Tax=Baekduia soli TaxID=496014 RepID=A0A5B8U7R1_9ACTN|nr:nucleotidyltransferase family protein [Baekduia soli]QEC49146.1 nucleotidyltransferase family protein [Baekduia soli]
MSTETSARRACASAFVVHPAIAAPLAAFDREGVRWCLLRGAAELDRVDGDVDLLVSHSDLRGLRRALAALGGYPPQNSWGRQPHRFFVDETVVPGERVKLDVVTTLAFGRYGELPTGAADTVLAARERCDGLWVPAPADAFWALLLHAVLDRGRIRAERAAELLVLAGRAGEGDSPLRDVVEEACPPGWDTGRVVEAVHAGAWDELSRLGPQLRDRWPGSSPARRTLTVGVRKVLRKAQRLQQSGSIASYRRARSTG